MGDASVLPSNLIGAVSTVVGGSGRQRANVVDGPEGSPYFFGKSFFTWKKERVNKSEDFACTSPRTTTLQKVPQNLILHNSVVFTKKLALQFRQPSL